MRGLTWETDPFRMPKGVLLVAYDYYDEHAREFIGYSHEIWKRIANPVWKLTGIGKMQLEAQNANAQ